MDYFSDNPDRATLSPYASNAMIGHGVASSICGEYDELTFDDFKKLSHI
jgi:hypothetical protein